MTIKIARIYDTDEALNGYRILVDRLWPRGISKEKARLDMWTKEIAPSDELRTWFDHKPERFAEFSQRYQQELDNNPETQQLVDTVKKHKSVVLLYGAKDKQHNQAVVLQKYLQQNLVR